MYFLISRPFCSWNSHLISHRRKPSFFHFRLRSSTLNSSPSEAVLSNKLFFCDASSVGNVYCSILEENESSIGLVFWFWIDILKDLCYFHVYMWSAYSALDVALTHPGNTPLFSTVASLGNECEVKLPLHALLKQALSTTEEKEETALYVFPGPKTMALQINRSRLEGLYHTKFVVFELHKVRPCGVLHEVAFWLCNLVTSSSSWAKRFNVTSEGIVDTNGRIMSSDGSGWRYWERSYVRMDNKWRKTGQTRQKMYMLAEASRCEPILLNVAWEDLIRGEIWTYWMRVYDVIYRWYLLTRC
jgi:hypothetical protein